MKFVQPIRDQKKLESIKLYLKENNERDFILFLIGINTGMRISDILPLRVGDVTGTHIVVNEKKTGKRKEIKIRKTLRRELDAYIQGKRDNEYLFPSRNRNKKLGITPICYSTAYKMIRSVSEKFGIKDVATHSMRKTFGYYFYSETKDIAHLMYLFNWSCQKKCSLKTHS